MRPIAQTFIINEPPAGVEAVLVTKIDLFFRTKSDTYGVEVQIRETSNGVPSNKTLPYATKFLDSSSVSVSGDGSTATTFTFDTPVLVRTNEQFAITIIPSGNNPDYNVWVGELGSLDAASTSVSVFTNKQVGSLFISTNDIGMTAIPNESLKYKIYTVPFDSLSANAVFKNSPTDYFLVTDSVGSFINQEQVVMSNSNLKFARLVISTANTFTGGEIMFQPAGTDKANVSVATAKGTLYFSNSTLLLLSNVSGTFNSTDAVRGATSNNSAGIPSSLNATASNQTFVTTSGSTTINVPSANVTQITDFAANSYIYVGKSTGANIQIVKIESVNATANTLTVSSNIDFTDTSAIIGRVRGDAALTGVYNGETDGANKLLTLTKVTSNASINFANNNGSLLIGRTSGASVKVDSLVNLPYESITVLVPDVEPTFTASDWYFKGTGNDNSRTVDGSELYISNEIPYEFADKTRLLMSKSNEYQNPPSSGTGNSSIVIKAALSSVNNKITPYIDTIRSTIVTTHNLILPEHNLKGYVIKYSNSNINFAVGDTVLQANATVTSNGVVSFANSTTIFVTNVVSSNTSWVATFNMSNTTVNNATQSNTATISAVAAFDETSNTSSGTSRYISKSVVLADQQDAEDFVSYLTAYRPPGTNLKVYGKFLAGADSDPLQAKDWSALVETSDTSLTSSLVNRDDFVELVYELPTTVQIIPNGASAATTSANVTVSSTAAFSAGDYIYIASNTGNFNVRMVTQIANSSVLVTSSNLSMTTSNASVGVIPGLESQYGAFKYANNDSIVRYTTPSDGVFDTYKAFATKIVLVSNSYHVVPRVADTRCLAVQV